MTTMRSALLSLVLLALMVGATFVRDALAAPEAGGGVTLPTQFAVPSRYFATVAAPGNTTQESSEAHLGLVSSAAVNRQFTYKAALLRSRMGLSSMAPVTSSAIFPTHSSNRFISIDEAQAQASRVAAARGLSVSLVLATVNQYTERFTFAGEARVNLPLLNRALDDLR